ncbi:hypothetical protein N0V93_007608 [Gnomoniopsis smithogilvyi]|uniref:Uncharacterized protein n=1 Tax=Gnomoniopsis smithogilvyi TaxID=1191159 RepID=A0A9W8YRN8_9PEZI|nr:hypothetical protein N0V93_007608 [Gnomoniopsis smithogilvyi]
MGRTLPWKKQAAGPGTGSGATKNASARNNNIVASSSRNKSPSPSITSTPGRRVRTSATTTLPHPRTEAAHETSDNGFGRERPARLPAALPERMMISGLQHDDKWRMVEDEFVAMAHKLTAHLHAAEYQRLKELAQDQNADAIQSLSRPVTASMTSRVKRRRAVVSLQKSQKASLKNALSRTQDAEEDEVDDLPWAGTNLEGLMDSPRKKMVPLNKMVSIVPGTRAAALSRKDSISSPKHNRRDDGVHQADSPTTTRKRSIRFSQEEEENFRMPSSPCRTSTKLSSKSKPANNTPISSNGSLHRTSSTAQGYATKVLADVVQKSAPAPVTSSVDDDSDSPVETMFGQHFRERRNRNRVT